MTDHEKSNVQRLRRIRKFRVASRLLALGDHRANPDHHTRLPSEANWTNTRDDEINISGDDPLAISNILQLKL